MKYKKMLQEIDDLVNNDFFADMEMKLMINAKEYTQDEAKEMAGVIGMVYSISHAIHCEACGRKYLTIPANKRIIKLTKEKLK